ncbi:hypothetical protein KAR91_52130 [Candidatus Pacearchaeota archaeon]|nr:hypothetical protein [Candidatus Pacearchaeota archaeon]
MGSWIRVCQLANMAVCLADSRNYSLYEVATWVLEIVRSSLTTVVIIQIVGVTRVRAARMGMSALAGIVQD